MSTTIPTQIEKCKGAMLATAIGDALGWPNEPRSKNRIKKPKVNDFFVEWTRSCKNPRWHDERILPGEYSDDTQMTLSVARSIIAGDWERFLAEKELPFWLRYERGGGSALLKAARSISDKKVLLWQSQYNAKAYFSAGGNGATMRILPHVIASANKPDTEVLMLDVIKDTLISHGHPRAFLGATCYAFALDYLMRKDTVLEYGELVSAVIDGQQCWGASPNSDVFSKWNEAANRFAGFDYAQEWEKARNNMMRQLEFIKASLKKGLMLDDTKMLTVLECFGSVNGAGDVATLAAIYLASRYATNPTLGIKVPAFSFNADTDTIASITGGLLGMLCGTNWIPNEWKVVQDYDCLVLMAELLLSDNKKTNTKNGVMAVQSQNSDWKNSSIGKIRLVDIGHAPNGKHGVVQIKKWQTVLGQTFYTKNFHPFYNGLEQETKTDEQMRLDTIPMPAASDATPQTVVQQVTDVKNKKRTIETQQRNSKFMLDSRIIESLLEKPAFKTNITIGKVLRIVLAFIEKNENVADVAKRFDLNEEMVKLIKMCIK
ncbi:MAG: ADP-ribosylglycohydrolase family protein [Oscillospiraceae bacterium]|jgi:ADP-ribosylglycohydrolase|nr:ADP-ribosylglycohydrolase family protein [Oscillospiraceae bacterium]